MMDVVFSEHNAQFDVTFDTFVSGQAYRDFTGPYDVTPMITSQTLPTEDTHMLHDVLIYTIPTREENNSSGGVSFIIGG